MWSEKEWSARSVLPGPVIAQESVHQLRAGRSLTTEEAN